MIKNKIDYSKIGVPADALERITQAPLRQKAGHKVKPWESWEIEIIEKEYPDKWTVSGLSKIFKRGKESIREKLVELKKI